MNSLRAGILAFVATLFLAPSSFALSILWTKTMTVESGAKFAFAVGSDGSVGIADAYQNTQKIYWYDRSGALLYTLIPNNKNVYGIIYVSKDELITQYKNADLKMAMELFQAVNGQVDKTEVITSVGIVSNEYKFSYPYLLESTVTGTTYEFTLYDMTSSVAPTVVGDAVIGIQGKNLQVRWKTLSTAKYKVQSSTDLSTWTDYSDVLNGTGSTIVVSIPLSDSSNALYARVVKL